MGSETERITNEVMGRYSLPIETVNLGVLAAKAELEAENPLYLNRKPQLIQMANRYREAQYDEMVKGDFCKTIDCGSIVYGDTHCAKCREEMDGRYVSIATVLLGHEYKFFEIITWGLAMIACALFLILILA